MKFRKLKAPGFLWITEACNWILLGVGLFFMRRQDWINPYTYAELLIFVFVVLENLNLTSLILKRKKRNVSGKSAGLILVYLAGLFLSVTLLVTMISAFSTFSRGLLYEISYHPQGINWAYEFLQILFWLISFVAYGSWMTLLYFYGEMLWIRICGRMIRRKYLSCVLRYTIWLISFMIVYLIIGLVVLMILFRIYFSIQTYWLSMVFTVLIILCSVFLGVIWISFSLQLKISFIQKITKKA